MKRTSISLTTFSTVSGNLKEVVESSKEPPISRMNLETKTMLDLDKIVPGVNSFFIKDFLTTFYNFLSFHQVSYHLLPCLLFLHFFLVKNL